MLISPHHNYNCNYTTLQLRHRLVRYYWYVYLYIYIYRTLYSICNWLAVSNLQFKFQYQDDPFDDCTCYTFTPAVYQSWEAAGLSPYFEVHPTWSFHGAQIIPGSTTIQLPTHQTNPASHWVGGLTLEMPIGYLGGWYFAQKHLGMLHILRGIAKYRNLMEQNDKNNLESRFSWLPKETCP